MVARVRPQPIFTLPKGLEIMNTETQHTINGAQAAVLFTALQTALVVVRQRRALKSSESFRDAIDMQISAYEGAKADLQREFPTLLAVQPAPAPQP